MNMICGIPQPDFFALVFAMKKELVISYSSATIGRSLVEPQYADKHTIEHAYGLVEKPVWLRPEWVTDSFKKQVESTLEDMREREIAIYLNGEGDVLVFQDSEVNYLKAVRLKAMIPYGLIITPIGLDAGEVFTPEWWEWHNLTSSTYQFGA